MSYINNNSNNTSHYRNNQNFRRTNDIRNSFTENKVHNVNRIYNENKQNRIKIFEDTLTKINCIPIDSSIYFLKDFETTKGHVLGNISLEADNTIDCAIKKYKEFKNKNTKEYTNITILNFADYQYPGGLVKYGSSAQEECICRCTNLYKYLNNEKKLYNKHKEEIRSGELDYRFSSDGIYSKNVSIIKDGEYNDLDKNEYININIISMAAPNMKKVSLTDKELFDIMVERWSKVIGIAHCCFVDTLIVGAWGCGAFKCNPEVVAKAFNKAAESTLFMNNIIFTIPGGRNKTIFENNINFKSVEK